MKNTDLANKVKELRKRKGLSQELLAEESGLSLRTVQRIENGETDPSGESLKRLSNALNVSPDELIDWTINDDNRYLKVLNLTALTFIFFPLLGIILPFVMWVSKKDKIRNVNKIAKAVINFEITWILILFTGIIINLVFLFTREEMSMSIILSSNLVFATIMYIFNFVLILFNTIRIHNEKDVKYFPKIKFLRH